MLSTFDGGKLFWNFLVARMQLYMTHLMNKGGSHVWPRRQKHDPFGPRPLNVWLPAVPVDPGISIGQ